MGFLTSFFWPSPTNSACFLYILLVYFVTNGLCLGLSCYECENCAENENYLRAHIKQCPDSNYISCLMTESKFAHHKMTSRRCSKAPAVNPDCSNHLVNIMRATVSLCDQPLCNGLFALANFTTSMNSRIFTNNNMVMTNNNGHINMATKLNNNKENFMPLHDFNEQRIAAMLGHATSQLSSTSHFNKVLILCSTLVTLWITTPNILKVDAHLAQIH